MDLESLRVVAAGASTLAVAGGVTLSAAIAGAMVEAMFPGTDTRVRAWVVSGLSVALRAFVLVSLAGLAFALLTATMVVAVFRLITGFAVTYLHLYRGGSGHRSHGFGRRGAMGWHRLA